MGRLRQAAITGTCAIVVLGGTSGIAAASAPPAHGPSSQCSSGARTLSHYGDHVYPDTGNGGHRSVHTDVHMVYDAASNTFLSGNHVNLTDRATQCLTDFSLD